ncbi:glycosyltransferase family 4 protein [bacterium]|nr:glycosyltransferase family 4 protein [bacterium]
MKILVLNYEWPPLGGGAAPVSRALAVEYRAAGHAVHVATMRYRGQPAFAIEDGLSIRRIACLRRRMDLCSTPEMLSFVLAAFPVVARMIRRERYDVAHCHFLVPTGLLAAALDATVGCPYLVTVHGSDLPGYNPDRFLAMHRLISPWLPRAVARRAKAIVAPSRYLAEHVRSTLGDLPVEIIPHGIDPGRFTPGRKRPWIVMSGRLLPRKGFSHVLAALEDVRGDWEVHVAGDGPARSELEALAARCALPVHFHGWLPHHSDQLRRLYEEGGIFCLPSAGESFGMALLEAMLAGMAVVTSDRTACPETVGEAGVVVPYGEPAALRTALASLLASPERVAELGRAARARVLSHFSLQASTRRYLQLLEA